MNRIAIFVFFASLLLSTRAAYSQAAERTGELLLKECQVVTMHTDVTTKSALEFGYEGHCLGYLSGARDVFEEWDESNTRLHGNNPSPVCLPSNVTMHEIALVVVKYLNDHPNKLHNDISLLVMLALSDAYPCKK